VGDRTLIKNMVGVENKLNEDQKKNLFWKENNCKIEKGKEKYKTKIVKNQQQKKSRVVGF
jgi:hypothetical protein